MPPDCPKVCPPDSLRESLDRLNLGEPQDGVAVALTRRALDAPAHACCCVRDVTNGRAARADAIATALRSGKTQAEVARHFGVTRQRVQQVAKKIGLTDAHQVDIKRRRVAVVAYFRAGHSVAQCASQFGVREQTIRLHLRDGCVNLKAENARRTYADIVPLIEVVRQGASISAAVTARFGYLDRNAADKLSIACWRAGVVSVYGRNRTFDARRSIVVKGVRSGKSWATMAREVTVAGGRQEDGHNLDARECSRAGP
jgi:transposase-like protein